MHRRKRKILKTLVLGLAVAAFTAPAALGEPRGPSNPITADPVRQAQSPDDRSFYRGVSGQSDAGIFSPDDRSVYRGTSAQLDLLVISPDDRAVFRGVETPSVPVSVTVSSSSNEFKWTDAGLGAALMLAFVLLLGAATLLIRHQRRHLAY